ncbi:hypothetical protein [Caldisalinibacter kiritimatiensis]|uniref:Probable chemoreceptor glutamine deamidase CheD n=1 Tax=Caldisalinibacter kiritimatiensis TaxID=1304284 RepID=R1CKL0_9FIRM|nr:hypothetical protein [Caldisalinibacter kiritimatiensis]EOC99260.1 Chemotaxis protein CheD [Caldisalinibacter kiritimatiensis]
MNKRYNKKLKRDVYEIFAGEYFVTDKRYVVLKTLLGSCVSVCLKDEVTGIAGMNHFMLPASKRIENIIINEDAKYGINAMELLINTMIKKGAKRPYLKAKVFGGGKVLEQELSNVANSNIEFVKVYLNMEQIPVITSDLGDNYGRKIFFFPDTFTVYLKKIKISKMSTSTIAKEKEMYTRIKQKSKQEGELTLF